MINLKIVKGSFVAVCKRYKSCTSGLALLEFALILPVLLLMGVGAYEVNRFVNVNQRLESIAYQLADLITNNRSLSTAQLDALLSAKDQMMRPYDPTGLGVIATNIRQPEGGGPTTLGQRSSPAALGGSLVSSGAPGSPANIDYDMEDLDQFVAIEVFYTYRTLLGIRLTDPFLGTEQLYKRVFARLRFGAEMDF